MNPTLKMPFATNQYSKKYSLKERFEEKYIPVTESGCWIWIAALNDSCGYGSIGDGEGNTILAHRASWILHKGEIPEGMCVCHKCDVPSCVNPDHLFLGTQQDNMDDRGNKNRSNRKPNIFGNKHPFAKLTEEQARDIKFGAEKQAFYHRKYGVPRQLVSDIRCGKTWKHINETQYPHGI